MITPAPHADSIKNAEQHPEGNSIDVTAWWRFADKRMCGVASSSQPTNRKKVRRVISREQGNALETIGHAVDYLNDCHFSEGPDDEIVNGICPARQAVQILISMQLQIWHSLPLRESFSNRIWNAMWHRMPHQTSPVIPLSLR